MRRKDREIADRGEIDALLAAAKVCRVAFAVDGEPYLVPLSPGYDPEAQALYFHTAKEGRKVDCVAANPRVCFEVEGRVEIKAGDDRGCSWGVRYESVVGTGTIVEVTAAEDRENALRCIMDQQAGASRPWQFAPKMVDATRVWKLTIDGVTGKRSFKP
jgi:nitroimidazol reductase NimA-like FMN-containing flavoprotein (pyridoxamine 5'-phosphate oxidase superfamily)